MVNSGVGIYDMDYEGKQAGVPDRQNLRVGSFAAKDSIKCSAVDSK